MDTLSIFVLSFIVRLLEAQVIESTTRWSNVSGTAITSQGPASTTTCDAECNLIFRDLGTVMFLPTVYTYYVATEVVSIGGSLGSSYTSTSLIRNNASFAFPSAATADPSFTPKAIPDTALTSDGYTFYWPITYLDVDLDDITLSRRFEGTDSDGRTYCTQTTQVTGINTMFYAPIPSGGDTHGFLVPPDWPVFQSLGLEPSWNCSGSGGGGGPISANVPVLSLTATSTIDNGGVAPSTSAHTPTRNSPSQPATDTPMLSGTATQIPPSDPHDSPVAASPHDSHPGSEAPSSKSPDSSTASAGSLPQPAAGLTGISATQGVETTNPLPPSPIITVASSAITPDAHGTYKVGTENLVPGGAPLTISGTVVSLASSASALVVGPSTIPLLPNTMSPEQPGGGPVAISPVITLAGQPVTANSRGAYVIDDQTMIPDGTPITISGTVYSLAPSGTALQVGGTTIIPLTPPAPPIPLPSGQSLTANAEGAYFIGSQTLTPGGPAVTVSGTVMSVAADGRTMVVGGTTIIPLTTPMPAPPITLSSGQSLTPNAQGDYVIGSQTLTPGGPAVTVSGTVVSVAADGRTAVIGGTTEVLASTTSQGIGGMIWSGIGGGGATGGGGGGSSSSSIGDGGAEISASASGVTLFTGAGLSAQLGRAWRSWIAMSIPTLVAFTVVFCVAL